MRRWWAAIAAVMLAAAGFFPVQGASVAQEAGMKPVEVYVMRTPSGAASGMARLFFVDPVTGEMATADVSGERFTVVGGYVLYEDPASGAIFRAWPDGRVEPHPFIQPAPETRALDWVVSPNGEWIAWMLTNDVSGGLQSITTLARSDGTEPRVILTDGPDAFLHAVPIALTDDWTFFFDRQPQGMRSFLFYPQYASIFRLDAGGEASRPALLPFEPNCFCGAGISANGAYFARLEKVSDDGGYDIRVWDLAAGIDTFVLTLPTTYRLAGDVLVSGDGRRAVYSLANNVTLDSAGSGTERFMLALVDTGTRQQRPLLSSPLLIPLVPLGWTQDGGGVVLVNPRQDGTWKLNIETGEVRQVAGATWVGLIASRPGDAPGS